MDASRSSKSPWAGRPSFPIFAILSRQSDWASRSGPAGSADRPALPRPTVQSVQPVLGRQTLRDIIINRATAAGLEHRDILRVLVHRLPESIQPVIHPGVVDWRRLGKLHGGEVLEVGGRLTGTVPRIRPPTIRLSDATVKNFLRVQEITGLCVHALPTSRKNVGGPNIKGLG